MLLNRYSPLALVVVVLFTPVAGLVMVTDVLGTAAPEASTTEPIRFPSVACENAAGTERSIAATRQAAVSQRVRIGISILLSSNLNFVGWGEASTEQSVRRLEWLQ